MYSQISVMSGSRTFASIPVLEQRPQYVIYGPLASMPSPPDVVLLFGKAGQMLILSEASQQVEGGLPPAMGRPACAIVPQAFNTGRAALSLGCCGARAYLDVLTDEVALWAIPGAKLDVYVERITALAKANAVLRTFHQMRRKDVKNGKSPTIKESLGGDGKPKLRSDGTIGMNCSKGDCKWVVVVAVLDLQSTDPDGRKVFCVKFQKEMPGLAEVSVRRASARPEDLRKRLARGLEDVARTHEDAHERVSAEPRNGGSAGISD